MVLQKYINKSKIKEFVKYYYLQIYSLRYKRMSEKRKKIELIRWYKKHTGEILDLDSPKDFCQKIQWLKLYDFKPIKVMLADKLLVRDWVKEKIGEEYLVPLLGVWDKAIEVNFDYLPNKFVLKGNHGSSMNIIITDKEKLDYKKAKRITAKWLKTPYGLLGLEQQYIPIKRRIIAEEYIEGNLVDFKVHCINGEPEMIIYTCHIDVNDNIGKEAYFDKYWNYLEDVKDVGYEKFAVPPQKPDNLDEILDLVRSLSKDFKYVRVDLYLVGECVKFGEMTFTPGSGLLYWGMNKNASVFVKEMGEKLLL